jgi:DNA repair exonuclease SbcCD nuclease subunit
MKTRKNFFCRGLQTLQSLSRIDRTSHHRLVCRTMSADPQREVIVVHSSDLHVSARYAADSSRGLDALPALRGVLAIATGLRADLVVLAGDTFEHNRQPSVLLDQAARTMGEFRAPIVILPGNHDPLTPDSVYRRPELGTATNLCVLGLTVGRSVVFPELDLEIWGEAHREYADMSPLGKPPFRSARWQLAAAHGHYIEEPLVTGALSPSWLIRPEDLIATGADYIALGHWNRAARVGDGLINAYYSGSPEYAGTVNVVRFRGDGAVEVNLAPVHAAAARDGTE